VARHYTYNREQGSPYGVHAVLPLAPVNFSREDLNDVNLNVLLPWCDGDVADLQGAHYFDDARYFTSDLTNKHYTLVMGGNHSYYNTIWTPGGWPAATWDDWRQFQDPPRLDPWCGDIQPNNHKLSPDRVRGTLKAYATAFFRTYLGGEVDFIPLLKGDAPPPPSATTNEIYMTYHAKNAAGARLDVNRMLDPDHLVTNTLGGAVSQSGLSPYDACGGNLPEPQHCLVGQSTNRQPHTTPSARSPRRGLSQLRLGWDDVTATYSNQLPAGTDASGYAVFQFRAAVNFTDARNPGGVPQDLSVTLSDGSGNSATVVVSNASGALFYPPGQVAAVPKIVLNAIRLPLASFAGVNLTDVQQIQFNFDQSASGALLISDLAFAD